MKEKNTIRTDTFFLIRPQNAKIQDTYYIKNLSSLLDLLILRPLNFCPSCHCEVFSPK